MSVVTVPDLGFGINPFVPRILPILAILRIDSGVAMATSKSTKFSLATFSIKSSPPAISAPAFLAAST